MGALVIPNLSDEVRASLERRATEHGRTVEAEAQDILAKTLSEEEDLRRRVAEVQTHIDALYGGRKPANVVDEFLAEKRRNARKE